MSVNKKKNLSSDEKMDSGSSSEAESSNEEASPDAYAGNEEIQVDFEGRNPIDTDFHGIRQLLQQLFLKTHINLSELANIIIAQNYIGSVVTQSEIDGEEDDDEDEEMYEENMIFGITTALNLTSKKDVECMQQLRNYLIEKAEKDASEAASSIKDVLSNDASPVGLLLNERFVNIPAQISIPLLENLDKEVKRANEKKMPYNFAHYLMIIKFYRKESKKNKPAEDIYSNPEEEVICKEADKCFEYSVLSEADNRTTDSLEGDSNLTPYRKVILFDANRLLDLVNSIKKFINE